MEWHPNLKIWVRKKQLSEGESSQFPQSSRWHDITGTEGLNHVPVTQLTPAGAKCAEVSFRPDPLAPPQKAAAVQDATTDATIDLTAHGDDYLSDIILISDDESDVDQDTTCPICKFSVYNTLKHPIFSASNWEQDSMCSMGLLLHVARYTQGQPNVFLHLQAWMRLWT